MYESIEGIDVVLTIQIRISDHVIELGDIILNGITPRGPEDVHDQEDKDAYCANGHESESWWYSHDGGGDY